MFHFKDTLDKKLRSYVDYRCRYSNCNFTYYVNTYKNFFTRAAEHMVICNLREKRVKMSKSLLFLVTFYSLAT